ncbi:D-alanyl-D-alanine carboxypeptidase/D-alanyl-D-alanine-endopeptidase [Virgibacillus necropolis]|uniref:D-alanyl-D-alanine carboxypeptidase/D-alanyl-D-alanine-endopeptidase n=2 Tax=Virgibacillus necropolis TaxID=163877 RepID=A0A221MIE9_9BACI|nr:D-alanyl-D-alanine carboxypeptidase/D-alanyl-D-alanine-endopeptidase [Virgibacillus necropolis]
MVDPNKQAKADTKTGSLQEKLDKYIKNEPNLNGALIGVSIRSATTGEVIYEHNGDIRMQPASNMKLFTGAAALSTLGRDYTFKTELLADGPINGETLQGNLYIKGKGDPTLLPSDFADFAKQISDRGITKVTGNVIADDTWYDDVRISPDLIWEDEQYYYGAQISALTASPTTDYDAGSVIVEASPGSNVGEKPVVTVSPQTNYVRIINNAKTVSAEEEEDIEVGRKHGTNVITIDGTIPIDSSTAKEWMAVWEPTGYALDLFQQALTSQGISWTGEVKVGKAPETATVLVSHESIPLSKLFVPFMKLSNNVHAEVLVKEMGKVVKGEGSWEKGLEVMEEEFVKLGLNIETMRIRDGSGISSNNLIPANEISKLLHVVQSKDWFSAYFHSLPVAGVENPMVGGTLQGRMEEVSNQATIQAKTGTIHSVSSLSGYINSRESETIIFSIISNHLLDEDDGKDIEDNIIKILANQ